MKLKDSFKIFMQKHPYICFYFEMLLIINEVTLSVIIFPFYFVFTLMIVLVVTVFNITSVILACLREILVILLSFPAGVVNAFGVKIKKEQNNERV